MRPNAIQEVSGTQDETSEKRLCVPAVVSLTHTAPLFKKERNIIFYALSFYFKYPFFLHWSCSRIRFSVTPANIDLSKPKALLIYNGSISFQVFFYPFKLFFCPVTSESSSFCHLGIFLFFLGFSLLFIINSLPRF